MSWRCLTIQQAAHLSLLRGQLSIRRRAASGHGNGVDDEHTLPLEDVAVICIESAEVTLTSSLLSACADQHVAVIFCGPQHHPTGIYLPFHHHSRLLPIATAQTTLAAPLRGILWQKIIRHKITLQAQLLARHHDAFFVIEKNPLMPLVKKVLPQDKNNVEAQAAKIYWPLLLGDDFTRDQNNWANAALNYGYAVARAAMARALVMAGLLPVFGIHHHSALNPYNLADDMMEPLRPLVDSWVMARLNSPPTANAELTKDDRAYMASLLLQCKTLIDGEHFTLLKTTEAMAFGLQSALLKQTADPLILPTMIDQTNK